MESRNSLFSSKNYRFFSSFSPFEINIAQKERIENYVVVTTLNFRNLQAICTHSFNVFSKVFETPISLVSSVALSAWVL